MDYETTKFWFDIFQGVLLGVVGFQHFLNKRHKTVLESINDLENSVNIEINNQNMKILGLEKDANNFLSNDDSKNFYKEVNKINLEIHKISTEISLMK